MSPVCDRGLQPFFPAALLVQLAGVRKRSHQQCVRRYRLLRYIPPMNEVAFACFSVITQYLANFPKILHLGADG
jgi:hypothetical protein